MPEFRSSASPGTSTRPSALITGAAQGIGLAICQRLAQQGHPLIMTDRDPAVHDAGQRLRTLGATVMTGLVDISQTDQVMTLPAVGGAIWSSLGILVNNAGISPKHDGKKKCVSDMALGEWINVIDTNLTGTFRVIQQCLAVMQANRWGRVISITSQAARTRTPVPGAHYAASKAGITGLSRVLAGEVAEWGGHRQLRRARAD